jgi:crossover junction endonuclease EME1
LDNTIDPSDPFRIVLEPAAKRRKVNPAPNILRHTYSTVQTGRRIARSFSDVAATPRNIPVSTTRVARLKRSKTTVLEDDPILFSSSPDFLRIAKDRKETLRRMRQQDLSGDDDDNNDPFHTYQQGRKAPAAAIGEPEDNPHTSSSDLDLPEVGAITSHSTTSLSTLGRAEPMKTIAAYEHEKKALQKRTDKARKAQERLELRETEKERKRAAKEAKLKEKEMAADLAKVNTLRIDKKVSTPAMIVDLPMDLDARLAGQVRRFLSPLEVVCEDWRSPIANVIKLRRKVDSIYNEESGLWEPVPVEIKSEKHVMCVMLAKEFVDLTMADEGRDLEAHVLRVKARFGGVSVIYLIESLTQWMRKNRNVKNRQFAEAMRSRMTQEAEEAVASAMENEKKNQLEYVDEDMIEDALLRLQMVHGAHIHHTTSTVDTAQWIMIFTQHISTIPYR